MQEEITVKMKQTRVDEAEQKRAKWRKSSLLMRLRDVV